MNEELTSELRAAGEALLKAWRSRSDDEQRSFARSLGVKPDWLSSGAQGDPASEKVEQIDIKGSEDRVAAAVIRAEQIAAVSGAVEPAALMPKELATREVAHVLDRLVPSFDRTCIDGIWSWSLKSERRASVLRSLEPARLQEVLSFARSIETDAVGAELRHILANGVSHDSAASVSIRALAYEWATAAEPALAASAKSLRRVVAQNSALESFDHLLQKGFFGRTEEIGRIHFFVRQQKFPDTIPLLPVSGIGGAGKSTLLAKALRPLLKDALTQHELPMIFIIDFDRRCLLAGAELELSFELSRQFGLYFPDLETDLAQLRDKVGRRRAVLGEFSRRTDTSVESTTRSGEEFDYEAARLLHNVGAHRRPLVLVLDTFEEWQREQYVPGVQAFGMSRVIDWLMMIQNTWELRLKVILSGRSPLTESSRFCVYTKPIVLKDLERSEALAMLDSLGVPSVSEARRLSRMAGRMPLALKLAARRYLQIPKDGRAAFLEDTSAALEDISAELRQGVLYDRFLEHIADEGARKLAHPGLALRRVSAELIQEVLAEPCKLGTLDVAEAERLFTLLAKEVWLVEEKWPFLVHRPELRRTMLKAMQQDPKQASRLREVHEAAARWYESRPKALDEERAEALYHRLALAQASEFDTVVSDAGIDILLNVAQSAGDFDDALRVQLLDRLGRRISAQDAVFLPPARRQAWGQAQAEELVRTGYPQRALNLWARVTNGHPGAASWYPEALFQSQTWGVSRELLHVDYRKRSLRYAHLMSFVMEKADSETAMALRRILSEASSETIEFGGDLDWLEDKYFSAVLDGAPVRDLPSLEAVARLHSAKLLSATRYFRVMTLYGGSRMQPKTGAFPFYFSLGTVESILASAFRPSFQFLGTIVERLTRNGSDAVATCQFRDSFSTAVSRLRSSQVLGDWAQRFAKAVVTDGGIGIEDALGEVLQGFGSDDPEWRAPIRNALMRLDRQGVPARNIIASLHEVLHPWIPSDLEETSFLTEVTNSARRAWLRAIEYVDRCGALPTFMKSVRGEGGPEFKEVVDAYLAWQLRRVAFESRAPRD